ncbi:MAG: capsule biosynthesis protein CapA [Alphaproteobacteria bacterium]|jgi:capsular polysaccharide export protein|nr:capsule biosynthesis protein CapA [Alphaproteobacteria bacterium]
MSRQNRIVTDPGQKTFLFLQGPHGPFFHRLGRMLTRAGAQVWRVGFNAGDRAFWFTPKTYIPYREPAADWPDRFRAIVAEKGVTDIVLYGDTRPVHAQAVAAARALGLTVHVFEEGYMRPYWVTYERGGSNGHSRLMQLGIEDMRTALAQSALDVPEAPAQWGDMRQHVFYGALYHWFVLFRNRGYRNFRPHRDLPLLTETLLYTRRLVLMPAFALGRILATLRIKHGGYPYHLALLQLEHDSSFQQHSPFSSMAEFLEAVIEGFAEGAPRHHHLVFKAHPLENGQSPLKRIIREIGRAHGVADRVHFVRGGKLAQLLDHARTAVTVNSTAAQQVLHRGIPLKVFGEAVYAKPGLVSDLPVETFFAQPSRPDLAAYKDFRRFLLETSQVPGGYYSGRGRRQLLRQVVDMMLDPNDPYDALKSGKAPPRQQLRVVN